MEGVKHKIGARHDLEQIVDPRQTIEIESFPIFHELRSSCEYDPQVESKHDNQSHWRAHQRPRIHFRIWKILVRSQCTFGNFNLLTFSFPRQTLHDEQSLTSSLQRLNHKIKRKQFKRSRSTGNDNWLIKTSHYDLLRDTRWNVCSSADLATRESYRIEESEQN